jgi:hypothetical protein
LFSKLLVFTFSRYQILQLGLEMADFNLSHILRNEKTLVGRRFWERLSLPNNLPPSGQTGKLP